MSTAPSATFAASLADLDVGLTEVPATEATSALADLVEQPAVGVAIDIDGVELPDSVDRSVDRDSVAGASFGVTPAEFAIADYGSIIIEGGPRGDEQVSLYAETHVAVLAESDIVSDMSEAFDRLGSTIPDDRRSRIIATGPSATADMGGLVYGAHGPRSVEVLVVTDR